MDAAIINGTFGWFRAGRLRRGVVLCGTLGLEQLSAHRWWRDLGESVAATGCSVVRFDYPGEGDSDAVTARLDTALDAIRGSIRFLREEARAEEIVLVGLRLGGTLASLIAAEGDVDRLVLLAPFLRGRSYLREIGVQAKLIDIVPDGSPLPKRSGLLSVGGFVLHPHLIRELNPIDLLRADRCPAGRALILGPDSARLAARYEALGSSVNAGDLPGFAGLVSDAYQTRMPDEIRERILRFVSEGATSLPGPRWKAKGAGAAMAGTGWSEEAVRFGGGLFGIRCRPSATSSRAPAVLLINMGVYAHSGYGRQTTTLARTLAQSGITSLRMDLRGVGDSADRPDGMLPLYTLDAVADVRAALDVLTEDHEQPVIAVGTCNGAYLAFHAVCQDPRISAAVLVNLYCFDWDLTHHGEPYAYKPARNLSAYTRLLLSPGNWRRVINGTAPVGSIIRKLARRGLARLWDKAVRLGRPAERSLSIAQRIAEVRRRGAKIVLLYSAGDLGLADLSTQLGSLDQAASILVH